MTLHRAVAVANVPGPKAGIDAVESILNGEQLTSYYLRYAVRGEFKANLSNREAAIDRFRKSPELAIIKSEQTFLSKRLQDLKESTEPEKEAP